MISPYRVAAVQFEPRLFAKDANIAALLQLVEHAAADGAKLITTPEMGTTGYCWFDRDEVKSEVEAIPGPTTDAFAAIAQRHGCYIVLGMPEVDPETDLYYNTAVLIGPKGVVGRHRKTHSYISEPKWSAPGDLDHQVFDTEIGKIALLICMDIHFIETARVVALRGADIICHISNWLAERTPAPYWISRGYENGCYVIESNRWGLERTVQFSGGSCIIAPDGKIAAKVDSGDGIASATVDLALVRQRRDDPDGSFAGRRPSLYLNLVTNTYLWNPLDFFKLYGHEPLPPGRKSRVAVAQFMPAPSAAANLETIEILVREAAISGANLVVLPELSLTGPYQQGVEEMLLGPSVERLLKIAVKYRLHIVAGLAESDNGLFYNTAVLVGPEGLVGSYRKIHLNRSDRDWAQPGDKWKVFDTSIGRIGVLIGQDAIFPESGRVLALQGCDVIACPAAVRGRFTGSHEGTLVRQNYPIPTGADPHHWHHFRCRGGENNLYFAFANWLDPERDYHGKSGVFGPDTFAFPRLETPILDAEGTAILDVDTSNLGCVYPTNVVRRKDLVAMRLPHYYRDLVASRREGAVA
jgi:predicted amidohydrolase